MITLTVVDAEMTADGMILVAVDVDDGNGNARRLAHMFPPDTLEWRAAEYDIDPADVDTLLDIVLHEPYAEPVPATDARTLFQAATVADAKSFLTERIDAVRTKQLKRKGQLRPPAYDKLLGLCVIEPETIEVKKEYVQKQRDKVAAAKEREKNQKRVPRAEMYRKRLMPQNHTAAEKERIKHGNHDFQAQPAKA